MIASLLVGALLAPSPASAEPTPVPDQIDPAVSAAELFADGEAAFAQGNFEDALVHFTEADRLSPHPATKFYVALSLDELGRLREAWQLYGVVADHADVTPPQRDAAARGSAGARSRLATVAVRGHAGGQLQIDGVTECDTPCEALADPGAHTLLLIWPGGRVERDFDVAEAGIYEITEAPKPKAAPVPVPRPAAAVQPSSGPTPAPAGPQPRWPTTLTWVGAPVALVGGAGVIGFGARTLVIRRDHDRAPTPDTQRAGVRMRTATNIAIGLVVVGGALLVADAIRYGVARRRAKR